MSPEHKAAIQDATTFPELNMSTGSAYLNYRFGLAMAGAPDFPTKKDNWIAGDPLLSTYTDEERAMVMAAAKDMGISRGEHWSNKRSEEIPTTHKQSPVAKKKKNRFGV